jgi:hypothetical protein
MKRLLKYFLAALVVITGVFSQTADAKAFSYTYTVSFSAGGQGSINGGVQVRKASGNEASASVSSKGDKIIVTGLEYGDVISCDAQGSVALNENSKYYVKGIRLSGRDNNTVAQSAFLVSGDQDYVVAYGIPGELAEYTVNYVDTDGNKLAESRTYYGNVGDEPVIAYLYIDGYIPDSYNQTGKLSSNASENVFNFVYSRAASSMAAAGNGANDNTSAGGNQAAAGAANNGAADGANAANTIVPDGQNDPQDGIQAPQAQPNTDIADEQVPQAANDNKHDIADEQVPLATMISESGMVVPLAIGALGIVAILAIMIFVIVKNVKSVRVQKNSMKHKGKDNKN